VAAVPGLSVATLYQVREGVMVETACSHPLPAAPPFTPVVVAVLRSLVLLRPVALGEAALRVAFREV
jgi:hypothetical protein